MSDGRRLGVQDALWLEMDEPGNLMVVDSLFWTDRPIDWGAFRDVMRERLWDRYSVLRSAVVRGEGGWWWEELPGADWEARFEQVELAAPGGDAELQDLIAAQRTVPLDRAEPLWRAVLVDGYKGGSAVLFRAHHAIADGIRMVQLTLDVFDATPDGHPARRRAPRRPGRDAAASPGPRAALTRVSPAERAAAGGVSGLAATPLRLARRSATNPVGAVHTALAASESLLGSALSGWRSALALGGRSWPTAVLSAVPGDVDTVRKLVLGTRNDATVWTGTVGADKAIAWSPPMPLARVRAVAHLHGATVNDVLITCVAQSLRAYLRRRGAVCRSVTWDVPVNLVPFDPSLPTALGNGFALVQLELPTDIDDPLRALEVVRRRMGRIKRGHEAVVDFGVQAVISRFGSRLYRASVDLIANRAIGVLTNVPGPDVPLYVVGRKVTGMMGWAPLTADQVMSLTIYSYDSKVFVGLAADARLVPDHQQIVDGFAEAFRWIEVLTDA